LVFPLSIFVSVIVIFLDVLHVLKMWPRTEDEKKRGGLMVMSVFVGFPLVSVLDMSTDII